MAAVLAEQGADPAGSQKAIEELSTWVMREDWNKILPAYSRCVRITRDQKKRYELIPDLLVEEQEKRLHSALLKLEEAKRTAGSVNDLLTKFTHIIPAIDAFFDKVMVMAEDTTLRENRLALLQRIAGLSAGVMDLSLLEGF